MLDQPGRTDCLLGAGSDPHHFQLSPRQIESLRQATLLVRTSKDDHGWLKLSATVPVIDLWPEQDHAWLDPDKVEQILPHLAERLIAVSPQKEQAIRKSLKQAVEKVRQIDKALIAALKDAKQNGVVMQHPAWRSLFNRLEIPILATLESQHHGHESGPRHLEEALEIMQQHPNALLIGDLRHGNRSLQWLADHLDHKEVLYLDALGSCGDNWPALMQKNIDRIRKQ